MDGMHVWLVQVKVSIRGGSQDGMDVWLVGAGQSPFRGGSQDGMDVWLVQVKVTLSRWKPGWDGCVVRAGQSVLSRRKPGWDGCVVGAGQSPPFAAEARMGWMCGWCRSKCPFAAEARMGWMCGWCRSKSPFRGGSQDGMDVWLVQVKVTLSRWKPGWDGCVVGAGQSHPFAVEARMGWMCGWCRSKSPFRGGSQDGMDVWLVQVKVTLSRWKPGWDGCVVGAGQSHPFAVEARMGWMCGWCRSKSPFRGGSQDGMDVWLVQVKVILSRRKPGWDGCVVGAGQSVHSWRKPGWDGCVVGAGQTAAPKSVPKKGPTTNVPHIAPCAQLALINPPLTAAGSFICAAFATVMICLDDTLPRRPPPEGSIFNNLKPYEGVPRLLPDNWNAVCYGVAGRDWTPAKKLKAVTVNDMRTLEGRHFLNDMVIDTYLELAKKAAEPYLFGSDIHIANCFFYTILSKKGRKGFRHSREMNNLFDAKLFIIPVHQDAHWMIVFVDVQNGVLTVADALGKRRVDIETNIVNFLKEEAQAQGHVTRYTEWECCDIDVPQQDNGYDCGVFICQFARYLTRGYTLNSIKQLYMPYYRRRMKYEIAEYVMLRY